MHEEDAKNRNYGFHLRLSRFWGFGLTMILTNQQDDNALINKLLFASVFVILPSFALSVAGKYLSGKS